MLELCCGYLEGKVGGKAVLVALESLVEGLGTRSIHARQVRIEHDPMRANREYERLEQLIARSLVHVSRFPSAPIAGQRSEAPTDDM
jgi:hypothetical protein